MKGLALTGWLLAGILGYVLYQQVTGVEEIRSGPHFHGRKFHGWKS